MTGSESPGTPVDGRRVLCLTGDVMTGRGIDQALASSCQPVLYEPCARDAREYIALAEAKNGPIARPMISAAIWGDALTALGPAAPHALIVNLETAVTTSDAYDRQKEVHYRMHPANATVLTAAAVDVCTLANNHVLDWGRDGLHETLDALEALGLRTAGAGRTQADAAAPAIVPFQRGRVLVFASGSADSGIPDGWAAGARQSGVNLLPDLTIATARALCRRVAAQRRPGDLVVVSIHWGSNWGYAVPAAHVDFAHALIDGGVDLVHGHSSHHPRPVEVYGGRLVLYGCGDFINDYEGIAGYEPYRGDLVVLYIADLEASSGSLARLRLVPLQLVRFRLSRPTDEDAMWLRHTLDDISTPFGVRVTQGGDDTFECLWA